MSSHTGTFRGTPKSRTGATSQAAGTFSNSPSHIPIPRPALETHASHVSAGEAGASTLSASRQKQSKRDEVRIRIFSGTVTRLIHSPGHPPEDRDGSEQETPCPLPSPPYQEGSPRNSPGPQAKPSSPDQAEYNCRRGCSAHGSEA